MKMIVDARYVLEERLAEGGMGQVYRARHVQLGKVFALKIIAPAFADDDLARARFNQEAKLASEISHPNIVSVVDFGEDAHLGAYMVMELVEGKPVLENNRPVSVKRALDILGQVAEVLAHIHKNGIVHGDVKADNLLLQTETEGSRRREVVRLLDFGVAQRHGAQSLTVDGTPHYLAPERAGGGPPSIAADIYALGVLGFHLLTGKLPFNGTVVEILMAHVYDDPPRMSSVRGEPIESSLEALIRRAMAKDPQDRHSSASAFLYELNAVMDMLAMSRRKLRSSSMRAISVRDATLQLLFDSSTLPQAVIGVDGTVVLANDPFAQLLGEHRAEVERADITTTSLAAVVPRFMDELRRVQQENRPRELRSTVERGHEAALQLSLWLVPYASEAVHVLVRVEVLEVAYGSLAIRNVAMSDCISSPGASSGIS